MVNIAEEHMGLVDEVNDAKLLALASERMVKADPAMFVLAEHLYAELGITQRYYLFPTRAALPLDHPDILGN